MKRCPKCASSFPDTVHFCEFDGARLVADYLDNDPNLAVPREEQIPQAETSPGEDQLGEDHLDSDPDLAVPIEDESPQTGTGAGVEADWHYVPPDPRVAQPRQNSQLLSLMILAGLVVAVCIGLVLFIVYKRMTHEAPAQNSNESPNVALTQQQDPLLPSRPSPSDSASPSPEPSPSPNPVASPAAQAESARALSSSPVSTSGNEKSRRGPVTIQLTNGTSIEADEAWETGEGIWYRRLGVVTLLERNQVKAIEKPSPTPSASATPTASASATPTASPSASPQM